MPEDCLATLDDDGAVSMATAKDILLYQHNMIKDPPSGVPNGAEELALIVSSMLAPQSNGREGGIQRSAHISPSTPEIQGPTGTFSDLIDVLDKSAMVPPSSPASLSSAVVASGGTGEVNADIGGLNKTGSWTSLHRLVLKMTKNNEAAVAAVMASLPRSGRMHLEGS
ncbi:hypothetical protein BGZ98_005851 [Dissophora globulifera]|nr:hypothetical protein BGZ98_005851 [Dissophora globulifera]